MAVRVAAANGAWLTAATWGLSGETLDSEAGNTGLTTAYVESQTFTPGAITIDGIAVKVATRAVSPSGTISVRLAQAAATVAGTEVTINVSDIDARNAEQGWYFFKFAAPVLLVAATLYTVSAKTSVNTQVNLYRNVTAANWSRILRTTTTGAPAAGDHLHIMGEWTAAATKTDRTVTMDETATTDYGDNTPANPPGVTVNKGGILTWGTTAATNYKLRLSTKLFVYTSGIMNMGTVVTPCPRDGSQQLEFDNTGTDGDFGLEVYGTFTAQGLSRTISKDVIVCQLNTDEAIGQTTLGVDTDTGWKSGDTVAIAGTTRTATEAEIKILNADAGASSIVITVALAAAHSGTSPTQAHVLLLTRPVRIESVSTTIMAYVRIGNAAICDWDWVGFRYMGGTAAGKRGVEIETTTAGSFNANFCSAFQFDNWGFMFSNAAGDNFSLTNFTGYSIGVNASTSGGIHVVATTGVAWTITDCYVIGDNTTGPAIYLLDLGGTISRLYGMNALNGLRLDDITGRVGNTTADVFVAYGTQGPAIDLENAASFKASNVKTWRTNGTGGMQIAGIGDLEITTLEMFGATAANIIFTTAASIVGRMLFRSATLSGDSTFATNTGVDFQNSAKGFPEIIFENSDFGVATGIKVAHATQDVQYGTSRRHINIIFRATRLASATEFANSSNLWGRSAIRRQRVDDVTNVHNVLYPQLGTVAYEITTFRTAAPSEKLTPSGATAGFRLRSGVRKIPVASAGTVTINAYVRKDGSYTGSAPRLILLANPSLGLDTDTVLDTLSVASGLWEQLTGITPAASEAGVWEVVVDCDGSAGNVFTDDWSAA